MIYLEDRELAQFSLTEGLIAVPLELYESESGEIRFTVYPGLEHVAEGFVGQGFADIFSGEAIAYLKKHLTPYVREYGLDPSRDADVYFLDYRLREGDKVPSSAVLPNTELIDGTTDRSGWYNATTHALEMDPDDPEDVCAVYRIGDTLVAYAALNDFPEEEDVREIHVECAPAYRKLGYATSCTVMLSKFLLGRGYSVKYVCRHTNAASARVAEKAGFSLVGKKYSFVCYRNGE